MQAAFEVRARESAVEPELGVPLALGLRRRGRDGDTAAAPGILGGRAACASAFELEHGRSDDPLRLYCELDAEQLLEVAINDEGLPDTPPKMIDGDWTIFIDDQGGYLAEVLIQLPVSFATLADKVQDLVESVAAGEHPFLETW